MLSVSPDTLPQSDFISHKLGTVQSVLRTAPSCLEIHGNPETVVDPSHHMCLQVAMPLLLADRWMLIGSEGEREFLLPYTRFKVNVPDPIPTYIVRPLVRY